MHEITILGLNKRNPMRGRTWKFPGGWEECTLEQLGVASLFMAVPKPEEEEERARLEVVQRMHLLRELSGIPDAVISRKDFPMDELIGVRTGELGVESAALLPGLDWCFTEAVFHQSLLVEVWHNKAKWLGPTHMLGNFSVERWQFTDHCLQVFANSGAQVDLHNLLGALLVPYGAEWNHDGIEARGHALASLPDKAQLGAVANYRAMRAYLAVKYHKAFRAGEADPHGMRGVFVRLAGPKFGTTKKAKKGDLHDMLVHVEQAITEADELKKQAQE